MSNKSVTTAVALPVDRYMPISVVRDMAVAAADSGVIDYQTCTDQLEGWWPNALWQRETRNTRVGSVTRDSDSFHDVYALTAYVAAATGGRLGAAPTLDSVRRGPAEMVQTMASIADMTQRRPIFMFGGGELKQCKPFGWKRSEGLDRMEDLFKITKLMFECDGPVNFEGNHRKFQNAWLGAASRQNRPEVWALGGGPKLMELAAHYADGFGTVAPQVFVSPRHAAERISGIRKEIASHGRDPKSFRFGIIGVLLLHDDANVIDRALDDPLHRFMTAVMGRINQNDWDLDGIEPPMPRDWCYAMKMLPSEMSVAEADDWIGRTTRKMAEKAFIYGTPAQVAEELAKYVEAGADWIGLYDMLAFTVPPEEQPAAMRRLIEVARLLKQRTAKAAA